MDLKKILVIQTAFIGDAILATAIVEKLHQHYPDAEIFYLIRKGNELLFRDHPFIKETLVWDKKNGKYNSLFNILKKIRKNKFDLVVNAHRYASSGFLTAFSGAKIKSGFNKNPFSFLFTVCKKHEFGIGIHEVDRNHELISGLTNATPGKPKLYPTQTDRDKIYPLQNGIYYCIAPSSVWFTKQWPEKRWVELCDSLASDKVFILGSKDDYELGQRIINASYNEQVINVSGKLTLLQSAALMQDAKMNFVNDSGPLHLASAMNAPVTAIFCSTLKDFGFYPLSDLSNVIETKEKLSCRPCGVHGKKECPEGHFKCGYNITAQQVVFR